MELRTEFPKGPKPNPQNAIFCAISA